MPYRMVANEPMRFLCNKKCGADIPVRYARIRDAYRDAVVRQPRDRRIKLPLTDPPD